MGKEMLGAVFEGEGKITVKSIPIPEVTQAGDVLIKVETASICGSDVQILKTPPGHPANTNIVLGHEYVGKVVETGSDVKTLAVGDRVVVEPAITCGACAFCRNGSPNMCADSTTLGIYVDGGFAEYCLVPEKCLHKVRPDLSPETAVFAEPLSCVVNAMNRLNPAPGETALVFVAGPLGLLFIKMLKAVGVSRIIVSELSPYRAECAQKCGVSATIDPNEQDLSTAVRQIALAGVDFTVDCVGSLLSDGLACVKSGGKVFAFGLNSTAENIIKPFDIAHRELQIIGSFIAKYTFPSAIRILENEVISVTDLITHRFGIEDFDQGLEAMRSGQAIKVLINF